MWHDWGAAQWIEAVVGAAAFWALVMLCTIAVVRGEWARHRRDRREGARRRSLRRPHPR
jgi:uncharacterized protein (DUF2062 family)